MARHIKQPTYEAAQHPLLLEWDYERNAADGIHPNNTTLDNCTSTNRVLMFVLVPRLLGVHIVLASKCANATL